MTRLEALLPAGPRRQLAKARKPQPPRRVQRSIWDGGFAAKKRDNTGGPKRGTGLSVAAPVAREPVRTFTETGDDLAFFLEAGRQRDARERREGV